MIIRLLDRRVPPDDKDSSVLQLDLFRKLVADLGQPDWLLDLVLVDDDFMTGLNAEYRGLDRVTDVLSFSYLLEEADGPCDLSCGLGGAFHDLWIDPLTASEKQGDIIQIGEVIIAPSFVRRRCSEREWSLENELPLLVVHGALHLLGWDHGDDEEIQAMQDLEEKILGICGLPHPLRNDGRFNG